jgi:hypothetical protein
MISDLITILTANTPLQTLIGQHGSSYKVYPVRAPQNCTKPYVIVRRSANNPVDYKSAPSSDDKPMFHVVVYAESYGKAEEISNAVRTAIDGYRTGIFKNIWYVTAEDLFDPEDGTDGSAVINNYYKAFVSR